MAEDKSTNQQRRAINSDGTVDRNMKEDEDLQNHAVSDSEENLKEEKKEVSDKVMDSIDREKEKKTKTKKTPKKKEKSEVKEKVKDKPKKKADKKAKVSKAKSAPRKKKKAEPDNLQDENPISEPEKVQEISEDKESSTEILIPESEEIPEASFVSDAGEIPEASFVSDAGEIPEASFVSDAGEIPEPTAVADAEEVEESSEVSESGEVSEPSDIPEAEEIPDATPVNDFEEIPEPSIVPESDDNAIAVEGLSEEQPEISEIEPEEIPPAVPGMEEGQAVDEVPEEEKKSGSEDASADQGFSPTYIYQDEAGKEDEHVIQTYDREDFNNNREAEPETIDSVAETIEEEVEHDIDAKNEDEDELEERKETQEVVSEILKKVQSEKQEAVDAEVGGQSIFKSLGRVMKTVGPILSSVFNMKLIVSCLSLAVVVAVIYFGYTQDWYGSLTGMFDQGADTPVSGTGISDQSVMDDGGLTSANIAGSNNGSRMDLVPSQIIVAQMYGLLDEPTLEGETGITAATYYGELQDEKQFVNQYVVYVQFLDEMRNLYRLDVYDLLDKSSARTTDLEKYLSDLRDFRVEGNKNLILVGIFMDELEKSYNSLTPDKQQLETDFFAALENIEAEKSDRLLKSFIDVSQKQIALKARVAALNKLVTYYDYALQKIDLRIEGIEKNKSALIQGIRVTDVPGSGIDLIIKPE